MLDSNLDGMALTEHFHDAVDGQHVLSVDDLLPLDRTSQRRCEVLVFVLRLPLVTMASEAKALGRFRNITTGGGL